MSQDEREREFREELRKARAGNRSALDRILKRLEPRLLKEANRCLGDKLRAKTRPSDIVQDACLEVIRCISDFTGDTQESFYAWVTTIIDNAAKQQHRHLNAQRRRSPTHTSQLEALAREYLKTTPSPATQLEQSEAVRLVMSAIEALREDYRLVIEQIVLKKRTPAEVAEDLGRSKNATAMLLSRARAALLLEIEKRERGDGSP